MVNGDESLANVGSVFLVGAGPGDPRLLTLRGREVLEAADLVLYDGLANPLLLKWTNGICERTARTRTAAGRIVPQGEINQRLIDAAKSGQTVVRLKGGDPYIFGRGSEEAEALAAAGIPFEVVPGITAATAAGVYAGFSYTHRDISSAVAFVTGHEDPRRTVQRLDYGALAGFPGTLVFYMGLGRTREICSSLMQHGKPADTPAAVISHASLASQQVLKSTLAELGDAVDQSALTPPSLIVIGECVKLRDSALWFERLPLFGQKIAITRPRAQADTVADRIVELGGKPVFMPLIEIEPVGEELQSAAAEICSRLHEFDGLVLTSANAVQHFFDVLLNGQRDLRILSGLTIAAVGKATESRLREFGIRADVVPDAHNGAALAEALAESPGGVSGKAFLWPQASRARESLRESLLAAGANVTDLVVYRHNDASGAAARAAKEVLQANGATWVGLSSPAIARRYATLFAEFESELSEPPKLASISPLTTTAATEAGLTISAEAKTASWDGLLESIAQHSP